MNKEQAAKFLGVNVRTLQRHVERGYLHPVYEPGPKGEVAIFDAAELRRFKANPPKKRAPGTARASSALATLARSLPVTSDQSAMTEPDAGAGAGALAPFAHLLREVLRDAVPMREPFMLSIPECAQASGVSVSRIRAAVKSGELRAVKGIGHGMGKILRADLERWARSLVYSEK